MQPGGQATGRRPQHGLRAVRQPPSELARDQPVGGQASGAQDFRRRVPQLGLLQQTERFVEPSSQPEVIDGSAPDLGPFGRSQRETGGRAPEPVGNMPAVGAPGHQRDPVEHARQVDRGSHRGRGELVVGSAQVAQHGQDVTPHGPERLEDLLPQVGAGEAPVDARSQLRHRRPTPGVTEARGVQPAPGRVARQLVVGEAQVVLDQTQHRPLGVEPGQGHRRFRPAGENHVPVGRQGLDQVGQPRRSGGPGGEQMDVVEDQARLGRRPPPHRVGHGGGIEHRLVPAQLDHVVLASAVDGRSDDPGQPIGVGVRGLHADPDVLAARRQPVLGDRLGQQRGLPQARAPDDRGDTVLPAPSQGSQQPRTGQQLGPRLRWNEPERASHLNGHRTTIHPVPAG